MSAYTPGPWQFDTSGEFWADPVIRWKGIVVCRPVQQRPVTQTEYLANARLITKAPELAELVRELVAHDATGIRLTQARALLAEIDGELTHVD